MKEIVQNLSLPEFGTGNTSFMLDSIGALALLKKAMSEGTCIYKYSTSGYRSKKYSFYLEVFKKLGLTCNLLNTQPTYNFAILSDKNTLVSFDSSGTSFNLYVYSTDKDIAEKLIEKTKEHSEKPKKQGYVFAIMRSGGGGLSLSRIGYAGNALEEGNYSKQVIEDYKYAIKDLKSPDPSGRIVILDGKPGTGKTYLVRSILNSVNDALFVVVPPTMVSSLGGPELLPLLVQNRQSYSKTGPTVLILEDADQCLAPRAADNIASISSLLNLGDGIFGSLLDIRIVATTNAKADEMDEAIMRPGRLSKRIEVGALSFEEANAVYQRLVGKKKLSLPTGEGRTIGFESKTKPKLYTLADVYKIARDNGWEPKAKPPQVDSNDEDAAEVDEDSIGGY